MAGQVPYLGSRIELISKSEIRYEGILYTIDTAKSTVALQNVKSFGTENRNIDTPIPASDEIFPYIIFRGSDIKDLKVCEANQGTPAPAAASAPPAAQSAAAPAAPTPAAAAPAAPKPAAPAWGANPSQARSAGPGPAVKPAAAAAPRGRSQPGVGAHLSKAPKPPSSSGQESIEGEFDFAKMFAAFDKQGAFAQAEAKVKTSSYNKNKSFFDSLDEEIPEDGPRKHGRAYMEEMRKTDAITFGAEAANAHRPPDPRRQRGRGGSDGRGRGRGEGGRGGGKGGAANGSAGGKGSSAGSGKGGKGTYRPGGQGRPADGRGKGAGRGGSEGGKGRGAAGGRGKGGRGGGGGGGNKDADTFGDMAIGYQGGNGDGKTPAQGRGGGRGRGGGGGRGRGEGAPVVAVTA